METLAKFQSVEKLLVDFELVMGPIAITNGFTMMY